MSDPFQKARDIRKGKLDNELPDYEEITGWIQRVPKTWLGGILRQAVYSSALAPFFKDDDSLLEFVKRSIEDARNPNSVLRETK